MWEIWDRRESKYKTDSGYYNILNEENNNSYELHEKKIKRIFEACDRGQN